MNAAEPAAHSSSSLFLFCRDLLLDNLAIRQQLAVLKVRPSAAAVCRFQQIVLGDVTSALAGMEAGVDPCPTGDRCRLASRWIQVVLEVALTALQEESGLYLR
jgi:hypothetical protein